MGFISTNKTDDFRIGIASKPILAIGAIIVVLVVSSAVSLLEFKKMSNYVSDRIAENIHHINLSTELSVTIDEYNLLILSDVGRADSLISTTINPEPYLACADSLMADINECRMPFCDSLQRAYDRYVATSKQLDAVIVNDFFDTREWYFTILQPQYNELRKWQDDMNKSIYTDLHENSVSFDESFYRGVMPGQVSIAVAILLCLLLMFFCEIYYIKPLLKMNKLLKAYRQSGHPYSNVFEGDDQLSEINAGITDIIDENITLKKRIKARESQGNI